jgi:hypothetical protein
MIITLKKSLAIMAACLCITGIAYATPGGRIYDPSTVETVSGKVVKIEQLAPQTKMQLGTHMLISTDKGEIDVRLGAGAYLDQIGLKLEPNDEVKVTGSKVSFENHDFIIAAQVEKDGKVFTLRNDEGIPLWRPRLMNEAVQQ